jgi:hypothetical protein
MELFLVLVGYGIMIWIGAAMMFQGLSGGGGVWNRQNCDTHFKGLQSVLRGKRQQQQQQQQHGSSSISRSACSRSSGTIHGTIQSIDCRGILEPQTTTTKHSYRTSLNSENDGGYLDDFGMLLLLLLIATACGDDPLLTPLTAWKRRR